MPSGTLDWKRHIIPVLNPDGYEYSLHKDRLWKKNRRQVSDFCYGVDLNRNFDYNWGKQDSTRSECSNTFCGPAPFSEAETQAFKAMRSFDNMQFLSGDIHALRKVGYGMAMDWMYFVKKITHSYILETRGEHGFDILGVKEILPAAKEIRMGIMKFSELM
ncbi:hypothetical protein HF086_017848 [Spodoptera exigua]|uniref:Peptidase M14 domain-containing protein n=1 Tax=Spodoptera exigua TaxID=7107 RepID=A0A922MSG1_SPOEX|nr:hypothetical protein HF086_017848 [Spodoptera exigua]